ncbi:MAG: sugar phosphate isomerase/epimerase family protein [Leadbetterella sp.]
MIRRDFIRDLSLVILLSSFKSPKNNPMDRIAMSTVNFRNRFKQTNKAVLPEKELTLLQISEYFKTRFKLKNLEFWSRHFENTDPEYLKELKKTIKKSGSRLVNIQMDEKYQIGAKDDKMRKDSLELALKWVDVAKQVGSKAIRINPGKGELPLIIESYKKINEACIKNKIVLMVENHFGIEMNPAIHLEIIKSLGQNVYALPDFGNYEEAMRIDALKQLLPYTYQVSAKTTDFDSDYNHISYDFDECLKIYHESGFKGIYSVEQWSRKEGNLDEEKVADWMIAKVLNYCK